MDQLPEEDDDVDVAARVHHVGIAVADLAASVAWYERVLGLAVEQRFVLEDADLEIVKLVSPGGACIELLSPRGESAAAQAGASPSQPGAKHVCFAAEDVEAVVAAVRRRGARVVQPAQVVAASNEKNAWIADPEGNLIEFIEPLGRSA